MPIQRMSHHVVNKYSVADARATCISRRMLGEWCTTRYQQH